MSNRYAILDDNGTVINIVKADESTAIANGWVLAEGEYAAIPSPAVVPAVVSMAQARKALLTAGITAEIVEAAINALNDDAAMIDWEYATEVRRSSPLVVMLGQALELTQGEINELFIKAASL